jgi:hypothetical protein
MKFLVVIFALAACASALILFDRKLDGEWEQFRSLHNKLYGSSNEESFRYTINILHYY